MKNKIKIYATIRLLNLYLMVLVYVIQEAWALPKFMRSRILYL